MGDDENFGECLHALQLLPNGIMLLLVTEDLPEEKIQVSTFLIGDEIPGFQAVQDNKPLVEAPDETSQP